jgi:hypothetical protein
MTPTHFGRSHVRNVNSWQKMTDTIVFLGEPAVRLCEKVDVDSDLDLKLINPALPTIALVLALYLLASDPTLTLNLI